MQVVPTFYFKFLPSVDMFESCVDIYSLHLHKQWQHLRCHAHNKPKLVIIGKSVLLYTMQIVVIRWKLFMLTKESFCTCSKDVSGKIEMQIECTIESCAMQKIGHS